jgi:hypothetical protein
VFPGHAERIHWSLEDPDAVPGSEQERLAAFRRIRASIPDRSRKSTHGWRRSAGSGRSTSMLWRSTWSGWRGPHP